MLDVPARGLGTPHVSRLLVPPVAVPGVVLDEHALYRFRKGLDVEGVGADPEDVFRWKPAKHSPDADVGVRQDEGPDVEPLRPGFSVLVLNQMNIGGIFEVQEPIGPSEHICQVGGLIGVAHEDARFIAAARTLANEADGHVPI